MGLKILSLLRQLVVTTNTCVPLLFLSGYLAILVIVVVCSYHNSVGLFISALPWQLTQYCLVQWRLSHRKEAFMLDRVLIIQILFPKSMVSSAIGAYLQPQRGI